MSSLSRAFHRTKEKNRQNRKIQSAAAKTLFAANLAIQADIHADDVIIDICVDTDHHVLRVESNKIDVDLDICWQPSGYTGLAGFYDQHSLHSEPVRRIQCTGTPEPNMDISTCRCCVQHRRSQSVDASVSPKPLPTIDHQASTRSNSPHDATSPPS